MCSRNIYILFIVFPFISIAATSYVIQLTSDSPIVKGGTINFKAVVYDGDEVANNQNFIFDWEDNGIPTHYRKTEIQNASDIWTVTYNSSIYHQGTYVAQVAVTRCVMLNVICYEVGSSRIFFEITEILNGDMILMQKNQTKKDVYVSNTETVTHMVHLKKSDMDYISKAPTILTYWFVDCVYYGITTDFKFPFNYTKADEIHTVEALVMADFTPLPPTTTVPPSTTTTKPTSTTKLTTTKPTPTTTKLTSPTKPTTTTSVKPITTTKKFSSTIKPNTIEKDSKSIIKRSLGETAFSKNVTSRIMVIVNGALVPYNGSFPMVCNDTEVVRDSMKTYGYFFKKVSVKAPVAQVNVTGNNWIQHGDLLSLKVNCQGSKNMQYCVEYRRGPYNVTGNETCYEYRPLISCDFSIKRYLSETNYTIIIIIKNEVSKVVTPVTVTFYEVKTQPQLSVIVVPVAFTMVAVVLIIFGVAYYIQNRSRFIVEVADFNFGQQYSDMEYKTFRERLRDSMMNAFTRGPSPSTSEVPVWPPGGRKYGSMT